MRFAGADEGDRHGAEGQYRRIPDRRFDPLQPDGQKSRAGAEGLADPAEDTALLVGKHCGKFGGDQRRGNEEHDGREEVVEGRREAVNRFRRESAQADDRRDVHDRQRHDAQLEPVLEVVFFYIHIRLFFLERCWMCNYRAKPCGT